MAAQATRTVDYIEDAATRRVDIRSPSGRVWKGNSNYAPPASGVHLCGQTDDGKQPTTVAGYPMDRATALILWHIAKEVAECTREAGDFVVDLMQGGDLVDDFWSNRQIWPSAVEAWNAAVIDQDSPPL